MAEWDSSYMEHGTLASWVNGGFGKKGDNTTTMNERLRDLKFCVELYGLLSVRARLWYSTLLPHVFEPVQKGRLEEATALAPASRPVVRWRRAGT